MNTTATYTFSDIAILFVTFLLVTRLIAFGVAAVFGTGAIAAVAVLGVYMAILLTNTHLRIARFVLGIKAKFA